MGKVWKEEEDALILDFVLKNGKHWDMIASLLPNRTTSQISAHWEKCLDPTLVKGPFTPQEDEIIIQFVNEHGPQNWPLIKKILPARSPKQCRERWCNHLSPNVSKKEWTSEEDNFIFLLVMQFGQKWSNIAKLIPGRTDNAIKNRFNSSIMKRIFHDSNGKPSLKEDVKNRKKKKQEDVSSNDQYIQVAQSPPFTHESNNSKDTFQIHIYPRNSQQNQSLISEQKKAPFVLPLIGTKCQTENEHNSPVFNQCIINATDDMELSSFKLQPEPGFSFGNFASSSPCGSSSENTETSSEFKPEPGFLSSDEPSFEMQFPAEAFLTSPFDDEIIEFNEI